MEVIYRHVLPGDNPVLASLIRSVFNEHGAPHLGTGYSDPTTDDLYTLFKMPRSVLWVAQSGNLLLGCCGVYPTNGLPGHCAELMKFYVLQHARGTGVGRLLMNKSIQSAKEMGYSQLYIESLPHYAKAVSIYEKQGFTFLNAPMGNSGHNGCTIWMAKQL
jgi:putative acetyltransferase